MVIKQNIKEKPETFYGSGEIKTTKDGQLAFKIYSNREKNKKELNFGTTDDSGKLIPDDTYYFMMAVDTYGRNWTSERIRW